MGFTRDDVARGLKNQFPHATIMKISEPGRARMAHERTETRKREDEKQRMLDEATGLGRVSARAHRHIGARARGEETDCGEFERVPAVTESGGKLVPRVYASACKTEVRWVDPKLPPEAVAQVGSDSEPLLHLEKGSPASHGLALPPYPTVYRKDLPSFITKGRRRVMSMTLCRPCGEILNENLGCQMGGNGHPAFVKHLRASGQLEVRRDQNGNPCEYLVSASRRQQAEQLKAYNRAQDQAEKAGWRGTRGADGESVKRLRHGGLTPD